MKIFRNLAVSCVALISVANTVGYTYLYQKESNDNISMSSVESNDETTQNDMNTESNDETTQNDINTEASNEEVSETEKKVETTQSEESSKAETTVVSTPDLNQKYEIKSIAKLNDGDVNSLQSFAWDLNDNVIYYLDSNTLSYYEDVVYYIYKYNVSDGKTELVKELTYDTGISPIALAYNQFDTNVYCFSGGGIYPDGSRVSNEFGCFNVESNEYKTLNTNGNSIFLSNYYEFDNASYRSFYFVSATTFVIEESHGADYRPWFYSYDLSDDSFNYGFIEIKGSCSRGGDIPFLHNENYYWLCSRNNISTIIETDKLFFPSNDEEFYGKVLGEYTSDENWCASTVYNNEVYLMDKNFSIYKVNLDMLIDQYSDKEQQNDTVNNQIVKNNEDNSKDALSLYIDNSEIKQTGMENLTSIKYFSIADDNNVIVFDDFDKTYKIISPNRDYN